MRSGADTPVTTDRPPPTQPTTDLLGSSVKGRPIEWHRFGTGSDVTLIIASIHGNEPAGTPLLERLAEELSSEFATDPTRFADRTIALIPVANPDGYAARSRYNARGIDLNRDYPADNFRRASHRGPDSLSQPESRAIASLIERLPPDRIISIHQPLACVDYDGPGRSLAEAMAAAGPLPVRKLGARAGSLGSWAGETLGIPIITLELPGAVERRDPEWLWRTYGPMLRTAVEGPVSAARGP